MDAYEREIIRRAKARGLRRTKGALINTLVAQANAGMQLAMQMHAKAKRGMLERRDIVALAGAVNRMVTATQGLERAFSNPRQRSRASDLKYVTRSMREKINRLMSSASEGDASWSAYEIKHIAENFNFLRREFYAIAGAPEV